MIKVSSETLDEIETTYPGFRSQLEDFESRVLPACRHCGSDDTATVLVGGIGRTTHLALATTKIKLIPTRNDEGHYWCHTCRSFFEGEDR